MMEFEKEFRLAHPETIGETDKTFDMYNYAEWLDKQVKNLGLFGVVCSSSTEDIYVSHGNDGDDDVYCAFTDHARGLKDCEESGTLLTHIKLYRGAK